MAESSAAVSKRPPDDKFHQQKMDAWQPIMAPSYVIAIFIAIGVAFIPTGITLMNNASSIYEDSIVYDTGTSCTSTTCCPSVTKANQGSLCSVSFVILCHNKKKQPAYAYLFCFSRAQFVFSFDPLPPNFPLSPHYPSLPPPHRQVSSLIET